MRWMVLIFMAVASVYFLAALTGCKPVEHGEESVITTGTPAPVATPTPDTPEQVEQDLVVKLDWERKKPDAKVWSRHAIEELNNLELPDIFPRDIEKYCVNYDKLPRPQRRDFWAHLAVALASHETTGYNPKSQMKESDGSYSIGLFQLSYGNRHCPKSKRHGDLTDPLVNISCAIRLMNDFVMNDKVIAAGGYVKYGAPSPKGLARYWAVIRVPDPKSPHHLEEIRAKTRRLDFCRN